MVGGRWALAVVVGVPGAVYFGLKIYEELA